MTSKIFSYPELGASDLIVDAIYEGAPGGKLSGEAVSKTLPGVGNLGGFRAAGAGAQKKFVVLYTSGEDADWPDTVDSETAKFIYFGDNRSPETDLHDTRPGGNKLLRYVFGLLRDDPPKRDQVPPFFVFKKEATPTSSRSARFLGLAVPGHSEVPNAEQLIEVAGEKDGRLFRNYKATFTLIDAPTVSRKWLQELANGKSIVDSAPQAWIDWVNAGEYRPLPNARSLNGETSGDPGQPMSKVNPEQKTETNAETQSDPSERDGSRNAWIVVADPAVNQSSRFPDYSVVWEAAASSADVRDNDWIIVAAPDGKVQNVGSVLRVRTQNDVTTAYFEKAEMPFDDKALTEIGLALPSGGPVGRIHWAAFTGAVENLMGHAFDAIPLIQSEAYVRELLQFAVVDDLLGPANGPHEQILDMSVRDRYLVGKLAPRQPSDASSGVEGVDNERAQQNEIELVENEVYTGRHETGAEFPTTTGKVDAEADSADEMDASNNQSLIPSSIGFTFCVDGASQKVRLKARWGRYERLYDHDQKRTVKRKIRDAEGNVLETRDEDVKLRVWQRIPCGGEFDLDLNEGTFKGKVPDPDYPGIKIKGSVSAKNANGDRLVTVFLLNTQDDPAQNKDSAWVFQPEVIATASRDAEDPAIFRRRLALDEAGEDPERDALEMVYRDHVEFGVGHGVSVHSETLHGDPSRGWKVQTRVIPEYEVPVTETPGSKPEDRDAMKKLVEQGHLDMDALADMKRQELVGVLTSLADDYAAWIDEQAGRIGTDVIGHDDQADLAMNRCRAILERLRAGIDVLGDPAENKALEAFRFANRAMARQRVHSSFALSRRRGEGKLLADFDKPSNRSWRPFQLAFVLLSLPALANPKHSDRTSALDASADLLWFPTGGGKTEAYLGVAAVAMAMRRFQNGLGGYDSSRGLGVVMRYTLRLLTLQQFQRATALICAMEVLRQKAIEDGDLSLGKSPFTIGLWVGNKVSPGTTADSHQIIEARRGSKRSDFGAATPAQLTSCPWCGSEVSEKRDIEVDKARKFTAIYCGDKKGRCVFSKGQSKKKPHPGLPVLVVDEEIYHRPPSMMIATVDKFALLAWRGEARTLFGKAETECPRHGLLWPDADCSGQHPKRGYLPPTKPIPIASIRPPDLIIQDEFHLISGPLGTMVGLYETAIDELSTWKIGDVSIRPKVVASTATVRKAPEQVNNVFMRRVSIFPPHGLDVSDNFFAKQRSVETIPGRRYIGVCSPGSSRPAMLIRVYAAFLTASQALFDRFGQVADPYMTGVGYFNSLRELGGMKRLAEDDVNTRSYKVEMSNVKRPGLAQRSITNVDELTSRVSSGDIPQKLDQLEVKFKATFDPKLGKYVTNWDKDETRAIDIVLATNMLSVGVDVNRLGLMMVNGQPKGTAEYIQATSRVGRASPGLVCTVLTWARPRDLSHYETFEHYHATFYKHVEAQSVTPFSPRALDRGLTGVFVSMLRAEADSLNPNDGAGAMDGAPIPEIDRSRAAFVDRVWSVSQEAAVKDRADDELKARVDIWKYEAGKGGRTLKYEKRGPDKSTAVPLLRKPGIKAWDKFTVPMSMREVEPGVRLIMDYAIDNSAAQDWERPDPDANLEEGEE
ncbi:DISARM system helicase DrmA [Ruegeria arenilitoris]|uniref:DISARM system helicase DrmA n=1 Tax=Ruegeria arenilitoris TaxID=1173585 RepID=UPI00147EDCBE|nr:DISARM system helicase DrmA [Ruegeria arenilitoris]